jgi:hypothetical protein
MNKEFVIAKTPEAAAVYLAVGSFTLCHSIEAVRRLRDELRAVDPDFADTKIYRRVYSVEEVPDV